MSAPLPAVPDDPTPGADAPPFHVLAVLGMHRSGTSWLAGSLEEKGLPLGDVSRRDPHNRKGNRESPVLMDLHEDVLRANEGSWKRPSFPNAWTGAQRSALAEHVAEMDAAHGAWGFKDPRALFLLDAWREAVADGLALVGIYRHPLAVHRSLHARNPRFTERRSLRLWKAYNERLVDEHRRSPFPLLRFDVPRERLQADLDAVAEALRLPHRDRPSSFFDERLVHNAEAAAAPVPWRCRRLWRELGERTGT